MNRNDKNCWKSVRYAQVLKIMHSFYKCAQYVLLTCWQSAGLKQVCTFSMISKMKIMENKRKTAINALKNERKIYSERSICLKKVYEKKTSILYYLFLCFARFLF